MIKDARPYNKGNLEIYDKYGFETIPESVEKCWKDMIEAAYQILQAKGCVSCDHDALLAAYIKEGMDSLDATMMVSDDSDAIEEKTTAIYEAAVEAQKGRSGGGADRSC